MQREGGISNNSLEKSHGIGNVLQALPDEQQFVLQAFSVTFPQWDFQSRGYVFDRSRIGRRKRRGKRSAGYLFLLVPPRDFRADVVH